MSEVRVVIHKSRGQSVPSKLRGRNKDVKGMEGKEDLE